MSPNRARPDHLVILGGLGDLATRYLAPALAELDQRGCLPRALRITAASLDEISTAEYRRRLGSALSEAGADPSFAERLDYAPADATSARDLAGMIESSDPVVYLALPPSATGPTVCALDEAGLRGTRVVVEKPFGTDLASAKALNALIAERWDERHVHRVDHFLGMRSVRNLRTLKRANPAFDALLRAEEVARVEITWDETLGLEGRAGYYDGTGALADMIQNHLLQVLAMFAMEPAITDRPEDVSRARLDVLRRTHACLPVRARYTEGEIRGRAIRAYTDEHGVDPANETETFIRVVTMVDTPRWRGVPFVLRTGKGLARARQEVTVVFRRTRSLALGLGDDIAIALGLGIEGASPDGGEDELVLTATSTGGLSAYARVLDAVLHDDASTAVSGEEAEAQWEIVEPVVEAMKQHEIPLLEYAAGSDGPTVAVQLPAHPV